MRPYFGLSMLCERCAQQLIIKPLKEHRLPRRAESPSTCGPAALPSSRLLILFSQTQKRPLSFPFLLSRILTRALFSCDCKRWQGEESANRESWHLYVFQNVTASLNF